MSDFPATTRPATSTPPRWQVPGFLSSALFAVFIGFLAYSLVNLEIDLEQITSGWPMMAELFGEMVPPATDRLVPGLGNALITFQMAFVGCFVGIVFALPLAFLAAANHTPHPLVQTVARSVIMLFRTVPELIWALLFVAWVGLGPLAGVLAIIVDTMGFTGRFFAESMEEVDPGPGEALSAMGAGSVDRFACATAPAALPSMVNTSLFALEKAVRASVVLGLVGAGGIGIELKTSMEMFRYDQASLFIIMIFCMVFGVERLSTWIRGKLM